MINLITSTIILILIKPNYKIIVNSIFYFFVKYEFYFYVVIVIILYFYLVTKITKFINQKLKEKEIGIYFYDSNQLFKSWLVLLLFICYYIFYLKILAVLFDNKISVNVFEIKKKIINFAALTDYSHLMVISSLLIIMLFYLLFFIFNFFLIFSAKTNYLKLHYYSFSRIQWFRNLIYSTKNFEMSIKFWLGDFYIFIVYFRFWFMKLLLIILLIRSIILYNGEISGIIKILPFFSLSFLFINVYNFIVFRFEYDFDILVSQAYYEKINFFFEKNELKKKEYIKNLYFNDSNFLFKDSIYFDFKEKIKYNYMIIQVYKYSINKSPNDFYTRISVESPKFINYVNKCCKKNRK
jgi:hypothetical protein